LEELEAEHIIHAPRKGLNDKLYPIRPGSPRNDGYLTRAWSPGIIDAEFDAAVERHYTPFFQGMFKQDQNIDFVTVRKLLDKIFLARCLWRPLLDEVGRPGLVSHIVTIPTEAISRGLSFTTIYETMRDYDSKEGVPSGEVPPLKLSWDPENQADADLGGSALLPKENVSRIFSYLASPDLHVLAIVRNTSTEDRRKAVFFLGKLLDRADAKAYFLASAIPVDVVINKFTVVVSERDNDFGNDDSWRKVRVGGATTSSSPDPSVLKAKSEALLDEIYGH
jgi:hypothetical protein